MSGFTDALLTSTHMAKDGQADAAIALQKNTFRRHKETAAEFLSETEAKHFFSLVDASENQVAFLLHQAAGHRSQHKAIRDEVLAHGETLSSSMLAVVLCRHGVEAQQVDARACIITDGDHGCAAPVVGRTFAETRNKLTPLIEGGIVPVLGGFIAANEEGRTTTLGRGGSDYTAALIGAALDAGEIQIWTDVKGVLTADPRVVPEGQTAERLSYAEAAELAYVGAKGLHPKTIQPAIEGSIPVRICNSRAPEEAGTLVGAQTETSPRTVKAIAHKVGVTTVQITSARMLGAYGFLRALFEVFERHRTVVDVVTTSEVSVSLSLDDATALPAIISELEELGTVRVEKGLAIICIVGEGLRFTPWIAASVFSIITDIKLTLIAQVAPSINLTLSLEERRVRARRERCA